VNRDLRSTFSSALAILLLSGTACAFARDPESVKMGAKTYRISGTVSGDSVAGIAIRLTGDKGASATTDAAGKFSFTGVQNGHYTIAASQSGFAFQPLSIAVTVKDADVAGQNFTSTANTTPTFTISGTVSGDATSGVTISLAGDAVASVNTDSSGKFSFAGVQNGHYTIAASRSGYTFQPPSIAVTVQDADVAGQSFTCTKDQTPTYVISGTVSGDATSGVTISLTGDAVASTTTDSSGKFSFTVQNGNYTIAASRSGYTSQPASIAVNVQGADVAGQDFTCSQNQASTYTISGTVSGDATWGVTVSLTGRQTATATTDSSGNFSFVVPNGSYKITASKTGFIFAPTSISLSVSGSNVAGQNFSNTAKLTSTISGTVSGLAASSSLFLRLNDQTPIQITQNGPFTFPAGLTKGTSYAVSVSTQPTSPTQLCAVGNDWGTIGVTDVANVAVTCDTLTSIVAANEYTCALTTGGAVLCWGLLSAQSTNPIGTSACANSTLCTLSPMLVQGLPQVKALAAGYNHMCAITMSNGVICWGLNLDGALGYGSLERNYTYVNVVDGKNLPISGIVNISAGNFYSCAVSSGGATKCWGVNNYGQLGAASSDWDGSEACSTVALDVIASSVTEIAVQYDHTCAVTTGGGVKCWGFNGNGELGATTSTTCENKYACSLVPLDVPGLTGATSVKVGGYPFGEARGGGRA
jgi:inhibitor of cysteine peptidase